MMKISDMPQHTLKAADGGMGISTDEIMDTMKDGTTIIAMKYNGGILLGADARSASVSLFEYNLTRRQQ
jgi:20S proteasome alpha/beta subunit